jgi:hypothetical protein
LAALCLWVGTAASQSAQAPSLQPPSPPPILTQGMLSVAATFEGDPAPITSGLQWRVYPASAQKAAVIASSDQASASFALPLGDYVVHVSYGLASSAKRVSVGRAVVNERLSIAAGGLVVTNAIGPQPIPATKISLSVFIPSPGNSEDRLVTSTLKAGELLRLPEGTYHVVSSYDDSNSIVRADIAVRSSKVVIATMLHRAATVTLKLVSKEGGEALANTAWTVLTPGGDVIREALGAFPTMTLAEGDYIGIARHDGKVYQGEVKVRSGLDRDVEIVAKEAPTR